MRSIAPPAQLSPAAPRDPDEAVEEMRAGWSMYKRLRRRLASTLSQVPDTGIFGFRPLRQHIVICGFPASGTTLLQLMLENGLPQAKRFGREFGGFRAATYCWRNHPVMISKVPHDLFRLGPLRALYATRLAALRILLTVRDPRDLLTARRPRTGRGRNGCGRYADDRESPDDVYCLTPQEWGLYWTAFRENCRSPDALLVRYEDLVRDTAGVQRAVEEFVGWRMRVPFADAHTVDRSDFRGVTLRGLRPVESTRVARWRDPAHAAQLRHALAVLPELPEAVAELGYADDAGWASALR
jgi:hypothetical protein